MSENKKSVQDRIAMFSKPKNENTSGTVTDKPPIKRSNTIIDKIAMFSKDKETQEDIKDISHKKLESSDHKRTSLTDYTLELSGGKRRNSLPFRSDKDSIAHVNFEDEYCVGN